jgi:nucleoside-diphosphate-sugar epimerase
MILITGAAGHIGKRMMERFISKGIDCMGIDCAGGSREPGTMVQVMDIRDPALGSLLEKNGVDSIIHLAFCTKTRIDERTRDSIDLAGSQNIADCAVRHGVRNIVFASSGRVYGDRTKPGGCHDRCGNYLNPADDRYAQNKIAAESLFLKAADEHGIRVAILRLAIVCWRGGGAGMGDMLKSTSRSGRFITLGSHNPPIQLVHVDDVTDACFNAIGKSGIFDIGAGQTMPLREMFSEAARLGGKKPSPLKLPEGITLAVVGLLWRIGLCPVPPLYLKMFGYDITRDILPTAALLGRPQYSMSALLREIVEG